MTEERTKGSKLTSPHVWVASTYFAEGFPYTIVNSMAEVLFKELGASLSTIGLTSLFHLPWNLKFLWGPFLDNFATKRAWLVGIEVALTAVLVLLAVFASAGDVLVVASVLFVVLAILSATHDIAIDGFYLEGLDEEGQSKFVGYRATAYKIAMLVVSGPLLVITGTIGWTAGFAATAVIMAALTAYHYFALPKVETAKAPMAQLVRSALGLGTFAVGGAIAAAIVGVRFVWGSGPVQSGWGSAIETLPFLKKISTSGWIGLALLSSLFVTMAMLPMLKRKLDSSDSFYANAFVDFLSQRHVGRILAFVVLFRAGESFLMKMKYPFLNDGGMTMEQYGFANGTVGLVASFTATLLGGYLISKHGLRRWIWPFVLAQNTLNLIYFGVAMLDSPSLAVLTLAITAEAAGAGFGTAVFMVYLMRCCRPEHKAAHMAIVTALMSVSFTFAGVASGFLAEWMGYSLYFGFTFLATIPGMLLIPFLPHLDRREES